MSDHAKFSPSASAIWMNCYGAGVMQEGMPDLTSDEAEQGTAAHELLELVLTGQPRPPKLLMSNGWQLDQEDVDAVHFAADWIHDLIEDGDEWETETRLYYDENLWGRSDFALYRPSTKTLYVVDYKHGAGLIVNAWDNPQGLVYSLLKIKALANRGIAKVVFVILQPRIEARSEPVKIAEYDPVDLLEFEDDVVDAMKRNELAEQFTAGPLEMFAGEWLTRGSHCQWCKANFAGGCPHVTWDLEEMAQSDLSGLVGDDLKRELGRYLKMCDQAAAAISATQRLALALAKEGEDIPGHKLVPTRPSTKLKDPEKAAGVAMIEGLDRDDVYTKPEVRSFAQLRDALEPLMDGDTKKARKAEAAALLKPFADTKSSGSKLVPVSDPTPALRANAEDDFKDVPIEE